MQSYISSLLIVCFASLASVCFAQEAVTLPGESVSSAEAEQAVPSFPYVAEITSDNVNIRSGPGTNYYSCGKLNKADRVKVVGSQFGWSRIVPPAGSFSWISTQYVSIDPNNPAVGMVTGDGVRVYAGSENIKPIHSTTVQGKLDRAEKVRLMGEEEGDYYKIAPPSFAYLWVSTRYTNPLGAVDEVPLIVRPQTIPDRPQTVPDRPQTVPDRPQAEPEADVIAVAPTTDIAVEAGKLKEYYALEKQIQAELAKPMAQQNYEDIKKAFVEIANNKAAGKAARYSKFAVRNIERYELALAVTEEVKHQSAELQQIKERIEKARLTKLAQVQNLGRFMAIGQFQTSGVYGPQTGLKHYRIIDDSGKTVCYALPAGPALKVDLDELVGRRVGLVGTVEPYPPTLVALVRFTEIVELK